MIAEEEVTFSLAQPVAKAVAVDAVVGDRGEAATIFERSEAGSVMNAPSSEAAAEPDADDETDADASSMNNILPMKQLKNGWSVLSSSLKKFHEETVKPSLAVAAERTSKFHEETVKPSLAVAAERTSKFHEETLKPAWDKTVESATPYVESAKEGASKAWEVTKEKTAEAYVKAKPHLDSCSEQCNLGVNKLVALVGGRKSAVTGVDGPGVDSVDEAAPSVLDSSTKGSFTI